MKKEEWQSTDSGYLNCIGVGDTYVRKQMERIMNSDYMKCSVAFRGCVCTFGEDYKVTWGDKNKKIAMTREKLKDYLGDDLCPYCPWTNNEVNKPRIGCCEGNYCEEALDAYIDEEGIILENSELLKSYNHGKE